MRLAFAYLPLLFGLGSPAVVSSAAEEKPAGQTHPVKLIFDTDIGNDIDDALALGMIHKLMDHGEAELLAVTISKDNPWCAPFVNLVNTFYGRPNIPIGVVRDGKTPNDGDYLRVVSERMLGEKPVYPHQLRSGTDAPEAVGLLRKTLAGQPDGSVVLVSVGFLTNMARLMDSKPDTNSPLSGMDLISKKTSLYVMMAGAFGDGAQMPEYNVVTDAASAREVFDRWPTRIVASGFEIGKVILYPAESIERDFRYVENHPIAEAYRHYRMMPYDAATWDPTAGLWAARPDRGYFGLSAKGKISLGKNNTTEFTADKNGRHQFLTLDPEKIPLIRKTLVELVSSPPGK